MSTYGEAGWTYGQLLTNYGGDALIDVIPPASSGPFGSDELLDFLNGIRQRVDRFRFDIVDAVGNVYDEVHPIRSSTPVTIENDTTRTVFRSLTNFSLTSTEQARINTEHDHVRPVMILQNGVEFPLGVFLFTDASRPRRSWGLELSGTLGDLGTVLDQEIGRSYTIPANSTLIVSAVQVARQVLTCPIFATPTGISNTQALTWKINDTRLKVLTDICKLMGYLPPYFDNQGRLIFRPVPVPPFSAQIPAYEANTRIVKDSILQTEDRLRAPNQYIAYDSGTSDTPIVAVYNIPASAPNSYENRRFHITHSEGLQGLGSTAVAYSAALAMAHHDVNRFTQVAFESTLDPRHDTFDIVQFLGDLYNEASWSMELKSGGHMKHSIRGVYV